MYEQPGTGKPAPLPDGALGDALGKSKDTRTPNQAEEYPKPPADSGERWKKRLQNGVLDEG